MTWDSVHSCSDLKRRNKTWIWSGLCVLGICVGSETSVQIIIDDMNLWKFQEYFAPKES